MFSLTAAKALSLDQAAVIARLADGFLQLEEGKPEIAAKKFEALDLTNDYPLGWDQKIMGQAQALASLERYDEAVEVYMSGRDDTLAVNAPAMLERGKFIEIIRPQIDAWKAKADQCIAENRFQEALTILTRVLALSDSDEPAIRKKIFETAGKMTTAAEISEEARKYMLRAEILAKDNDLIGAVTELRHAIKRAPFAANLYYNASVHYGNLEKYAEAIRYMKLYLEAAPDSPSSRAVKDKVIEWELLLEKKGR
jgi:tetratricopeptide (TPR) repeat protein